MPDLSPLSGEERKDFASARSVVVAFGRPEDDGHRATVFITRIRQAIEKRLIGHGHFRVTSSTVHEPDARHGLRLCEGALEQKDAREGSHHS